MSLPYLPPSPSDRTVTFTVPKEIDPYLVEWFQATKRNGESVQNFVLRNIMVPAKKWWAENQVEIAAEARRQELAALRTESDTFVNT